MAPTPKTKAHVVIVGGGFGGLNAAKRLGGKPGVQVTLVDRANHHLFQPLLYQVATAALSPGDIASPIRAILKKYKNVQVLLGEVTGLDPVGKRVILKDGQLSYDYLLLAAGARHAYFGHDAWEADAPGLKSLEDALEMRKRILLAFEAAEREPDEAKKAGLLNFVIVGGGPTGVELAGAISEIARQTIAQDFRSIDPRKARVILVEAGPRLLPAFSEESSAKAEASLVEIGVEVRKGVPVTAVTDESVTVGSEVIPTRCALWAAGVAASPLAKSLGVPLDRAGRVPVDRNLAVPQLQGVFVVGDLANFTARNGRPLPGVAQVALQQGDWAAKNILRTVDGRVRLPFDYVDKGNMATIGRASAVAEISGFHFAGLFAWLVWLFVHILFLIGFPNKMSVLVKWIFAFFGRWRSSRLITGEVPSILPSARLRLEKSST